MEPTPAPPQVGIASARALELTTQVDLALAHGNITDARKSAHTAQLLHRKRTTTFSPSITALIMFASGRSLHANALLLQQTTERDAELQLSMKLSPGLLRKARSRLGQAFTILTESPSNDQLLIAQVQSTRGLVQFDISQQRARYRKDGRIERLTRKKQAQLRQRGVDEMRAAVERLRASPQPATYQSLEIYRNMIACCGLLEKGHYLVEAIEQCEHLGLPRAYALDPLLGRRSTVKALARFYAQHTTEPKSDSASIVATPQG